MKSPKLLICPCCGAKGCGDLNAEPCAGCGALAVGPPLARPDGELPSYGLPLAVGAAGALLALVFLAYTVLTLAERKPFAVDLWSFVAAGETAAWQLKWAVLPLALLASVLGRRALCRIVRAPSRFALVRFARAGFVASSLLAFVVIALIGLTVPERLRQRELARQAAERARAYDPVRVLLDYQQRYGTLPTSPDELKKLPDPDGSVARAVEMIRSGRYEPESTIAALPPTKARGRRNTNVAIRPVAVRTDPDEPSGEGFTFTNYTLRLAGEDGKLGTDDDLLVRDGMILPAPPRAEQPAGALVRKPGLP